MTDWAAIAKASGIAIPEGEEARLTGPLTALEQTFRPLLKNLSPLMEPDLELHLTEDEQ